MDDLINAFSVQLAQFAYPLMSACAVFWLIVAGAEWRKYRRIEQVTRALFLFTVLAQFNWLAVIAGAPWWIPDMTPYRPYIRFGWSLVALAWALHTLTMIKVWRETRESADVQTKHGRYLVTKRE
jgi:hypothetical protein